MIKLLVTSFYNTLINEEDAIPTSTMLELDRVKQTGIKFCVITNRLQEDVLYYNQDYPFIDYIVSLNGGVVLDVNQNQTLEKKAFTKSELESISKEYAGKEITYFTKEKEEQTIPQEPVYKIEIKGAKKKKSTKYVETMLKRNKENFLEIAKNTPYDSLKSIKKEEILAIIGNESEKPILENIENTYVVKNAPKALRDQTKKITSSNIKKGVEQVIKEEIK